MKKIHSLKKLIVSGAVLAALSIGAASALAQPAYTNPMQIAASLTERSVDSIADECYTSGKSPAQIADEAGKPDEFKADMQELRKARLDEAVADGRMSQERADRILADSTDGDYSEYCYGRGWDNDSDYRGNRGGCGMW